MDNKGVSIAKQFDQLVAHRLPLEKYWRDAYEYSYPIRGESFFNKTGDGVSNAASAKQRQSKIYDSTATDAVRLLASSMISGLTPTNAQWFNLTIPNVPDSQIPRDVRQWLQQSSETLFSMIHSSNYNAQGFEFFIDMAIAGQCGLYIELSDTGGFHFEHWPLASLYCQETLKQHKIDTVYRRVSFSAIEAKNRFKTTLPDFMEEELKNNPSSPTLFGFIHTVRPRMIKGKQSKGKLAKQQAFESIYVCEKTKTVVYESGFHEFPAIIPRWSVIPDTDYAVGPLNDAMPDVKTLNSVVEMILSNAEMAIAGTFVVKDDGVINPSTIRIGPRKVIAAADTDVNQRAKLTRKPG